MKMMITKLTMLVYSAFIKGCTHSNKNKNKSSSGQQKKYKIYSITRIKILIKGFVGFIEKYVMNAENVLNGVKYH